MSPFVSRTRTVSVKCNQGSPPPALLFQQGCNNPDKTAPTEPTQAFKYQVETYDGTRAVTGNMCVGWGSCPDLTEYVSDTGLNMSLQLDVQGFSHVSSAVFEAYHARWPAKPLVASECCSCETQRGEADDIPYNSSLVYYSEFNADCQAKETNYALSLPYVSGSFVWTAFDYVRGRIARGAVARRAPLRSR